MFLAIELLVVTALAIAGFSHWNQPLSILTHPVGSNGHGGLASVAAGAIIAAIATALFSVNGYDSGINFAEEVLGSAAKVGRAVVTAAAPGIVFELVPFIAIVFGAPNLAHFVNSPTPVTSVAGDVFGNTFLTIITIGGLVAIFNASIAITLRFSRVVWPGSRDVAWPKPVSPWLSKVLPGRGTPWVATLVVGVLATILCFQSTLIAVVTFTAVLTVIVYRLIAVSALVSRVRQRALPRPSRMPLWPVPPIIALAGVVIALSQQKLSDLLLAAAIFAAALIYYFAFVRPRGGRYWVVGGAVTEPAVAPVKEEDAPGA